MKDNPGYNKMKIIKYRRINDIELIPSRFNVITGSGNGITSILEVLMLSEVDTIEDLHEATNFINIARSNKSDYSKGVPHGVDSGDFLLDRNGIISMESGRFGEDKNRWRYRKYKVRSHSGEYVDALRHFDHHHEHYVMNKGQYIPEDIIYHKNNVYYGKMPVEIMNPFGKFARKNEEPYKNNTIGREEFLEHIFPFLGITSLHKIDLILYSSNDPEKKKQIFFSELSHSAQYILRFARLLNNEKLKSIFIDDFASYVKPSHLDDFIIAIKKATDAMGISISISSRNKDVIDSFTRIYGEETSIHILDNKNELKTISHDHFIKALDLANLDVTRM
jgi:hypothetical protein